MCIVNIGGFPQPTIKIERDIAYCSFASTGMEIGLTRCNSPLADSPLATTDFDISCGKTPLITGFAKGNLAEIKCTDWILLLVVCLVYSCYTCVRVSTDVYVDIGHWSIKTKKCTNYTVGHSKIQLGGRNKTYFAMSSERPHFYSRQEI